MAPEGQATALAGAAPCPARSRDEQMGRIIGAIVLPDAWMERLLAKIHLADEVKRVEQERGHVDQRLKLGQVYMDDCLTSAHWLKADGLSRNSQQSSSTLSLLQRLGQSFSY